MTDIVERLRAFSGVLIVREAADEIERLRVLVREGADECIERDAEIERLRGELRLTVAGAERDVKHLLERLHVANKIIERDPSEAAKEIERLRGELANREEQVARLKQERDVEAMTDLTDHIARRVKENTAMMTDIVGLLREAISDLPSGYWNSPLGRLIADAAAEIERLRDAHDDYVMRLLDMDVCELNREIERLRGLMWKP